jgi:2-dehydropantoate 2-reductase
MRILVVGAGATGGYFGARLAQAGRDVTFLVRPRRAAVLQERGLRLTGPGDAEVITPNLVTADRLTEPYDLVLLSVKATALDQALDDLAPAVGEHTAIVPFLNGMAHMDALNARFGDRNVLGGVVIVATTISEEGDIVRLGPGGSMTTGEQHGEHTTRLRDIEKTLSDANFDLTTTSDIIAKMWEKWIFIATTSAMVCLMRGTIGDVLAVPDGDRLGPAILAEAAATAAAAGHPAAPAWIDMIEKWVTAHGSAGTTSMYRDLTSGVPTEVEQILGDLTARAVALSVPAPLLGLATMHLRVHEEQLKQR